MFPLADARGRVVGFQARKLREDDPLRGKYVNTPESELFKKGAVLYGLHLAVIAALNAVLWWLATRGTRSPEIIGAIFPVLILLPAAGIAAVWPQYVQYVWFLAFGGVLIRRLSTWQSHDNGSTGT